MVVKASIVKGSLAAARYKELGEKNAIFLYQNEMYGENFRERFFEFKTVVGLYSGSKLEKPFVENVISPERGTADSVDELRGLAIKYANEMGFSDNQWYAVAHFNTHTPHIHLIANRVDFDGKCNIDAYMIGERAGRVADKICKERGWKTSKEIGQEKKNDFKNKLLESLEESSGWEELRNNLEKRGIWLELNQSVNTVNGLRLCYLEERREWEEKARRKEQAFKKGFKLSEIDRKLKVKNIEEKFYMNKTKVDNKNITIKAQNYGRKF